uniref:hypothetical protein n=1 Tax=Actinomadura sp. CA-154981 TaxID=3240037 RepID=UPI003F49AF1F
MAKPDKNEDSGSDKVNPQENTKTGRVIDLTMRQQGSDVEAARQQGAAWEN